MWINGTFFPKINHSTLTATPTTTEDVVGIGCGLVGVAGKLVVAYVIGDADAIWNVLSPSGQDNYGIRIIFCLISCTACVQWHTYILSNTRTCTVFSVSNGTRVIFYLQNPLCLSHPMAHLCLSHRRYMYNTCTTHAHHNNYTSMRQYL